MGCSARRPAWPLRARSRARSLLIPSKVSFTNQGLFEVPTKLCFLCSRWSRAMSIFPSKVCFVLSNVCFDPEQGLFFYGANTSSEPVLPSLLLHFSRIFLKGIQFTAYCRLRKPQAPHPTLRTSNTQTHPKRLFARSRKKSRP